jgi:hypothetical protein
MVRGDSVAVRPQELAEEEEGTTVSTLQVIIRVRPCVVGGEVQAPHTSGG